MVLAPTIWLNVCLLVVQKIKTVPARRLHALIKLVLLSVLIVSSALSMLRIFPHPLLTRSLLAHPVLCVLMVPAAPMLANAASSLVVL